MGRRGPKPLPKKVLRARGSRWADRPYSEPEGNVELPAEAPKKPRGLPKAAREEWDRVTPHLVRVGVLAVVDRAVLISYCRAVADVEELAAACAEEGHYEATSTGGTQRTGCSRALESSRRLMLQLGRELGLTPSSRSSLRRPGGEAKEKDPLSRAGDARRGRQGANGSGPRIRSARDGPTPMDGGAS